MAPNEIAQFAFDCIFVLCDLLAHFGQNQLYINICVYISALFWLRLHSPITYDQLPSQTITYKRFQSNRCSMRIGMLEKLELANERIKLLS